jgi:hypothetical protein
MAAMLYLLLAPVRAQRRERRELLATGQAAVGTIVATDAMAQGKSGTINYRFRGGLDRKQPVAT